MVLHHGKADYELTLWISSDCFFRMENDFCERSFRVGEIVMNENTVESDERAIIVQRGNKVLEPLSLYYPKELLKVSLSVASGDIIFQVENATFVDGGCQGRRTCKNHQSLLMPSEPVGVKIWAGKYNSFDNLIGGLGWASEHGFVKISKDFILRPSSGSSDIHALAPLVIPRDSQSGTGDKDYLKARNSVVLERRKQQPEEELEIFEEPEAENQTELEEEEEEEEEILPAITAAGNLSSLKNFNPLF